MTSAHDAEFGAPAMAALFDDAARLQAMLDVEAALARAEARLGVIPAEAGAAIVAQCRAGLFDAAAVFGEAGVAGNPAIPLVRHLTARLDAGTARYVHWGGTSQDLIDTGAVLQMRRALALLEEMTAALATACAGHAERHRRTPMIGRTLLQQALPITFGLKAAHWLALATRQVERLRELAGRALVLQFGGAAGTLASLGADGLRVMQALAEELALPMPELPWHTERDRLAEIAGGLGTLAGGAAKIAQDLVLLMQTEVAEAFEAPGAGKGGSSTLPHKRNPVDALFALAAARKAIALVPAVQGAMLQEHERAAGAWHAEWILLPELFTLAAGTVARAGRAVATLDVDAARMRRNLDLTDGLVMAEAVMMALAPKLGRPRAHHLLQTACRQAQADGVHLKAVLARDAEITRALTPAEIEGCFDPLRYQGAGDQFITRALQRFRAVVPA
jgi:3-carboxy-cis,cis-muconate cycloisomerase